MLSQSESYHAYMAYKFPSNFYEAEKAIFQVVKESEGKEPVDVETMGYVWCLHGEVCGELGQSDRLRKSFGAALKKTNNSPLVRLYFVRALIYYSIDVSYALSLAEELIAEVTSKNFSGLPIPFAEFHWG